MIQIVVAGTDDANEISEWWRQKETHSIVIPERASGRARRARVFAFHTTGGPVFGSWAVAQLPQELNERRPLSILPRTNKHQDDNYEDIQTGPNLPCPVAKLESRQKAKPERRERLKHQRDDRNGE